ncbi:MAG TPA: efflux RND transporter permease subunit, partial [Pseudobdellovibrionaceae bacterium]|nr:efflux RND transporter permease subunit [Pseudobdellovibrionaceae bacterium]
VEYVYSASSPHVSLVTVRFKVGEPLEPSILKIHHKLAEIKSQLPIMAQASKVKSYSIDDVPFLILSFSSAEKNDFDLRTLIAPLARDLSSTPDLSRVELLGGRKRSIRVIVDSQRLSQRGVSLVEVADALTKNDAFGPVGKTWGNEEVYDVEVGGRVESAKDIEHIAVAQKGGAVVQIKDIAQVVDGPEEVTRGSLLIDKSGKSETAVSIVFAKRKGTNVVNLAEQLLHHAEVFSKKLPSDIKLSVLRNYGHTAHEKTVELIEHLLLATFSVSVLIALAMGIRSALVVAIAIPVTLALTIAIYYFMGYTLNRVTLFALIFSIGILVDDAIVVVENIERHLRMNHKDSLVKSTIRAVSEVGNPTILATFTVIAAILPMAFVRGLMGPYMKPIPVGASLAMILSLFVAFIVTPWAAVRLLKKEENHVEDAKESYLDKKYKVIIDWLLKNRRNAFKFGVFSVLLLVFSSALLFTKDVKVKMLPFDNKDEFQVTVDYPTNTPLAVNMEWSKELAEKIAQSPHVEKVQIFSGEPAPYSFSGMVKHTYLRKTDYQSDFQIKLSNKKDRDESSHEIINRLRPLIESFANSKKAISKVLEIPPGPPVMATMVAEVYGPSREDRERVSEEVLQIFKTQTGFVDVDSTLRKSRSRLQYRYDHYMGGVLGTKASLSFGTGQMLFSEVPLFSLSDVSGPEEVTVDFSVKQSIRSSLNPFQGQNVPSFESGVISLSKVLKEPKLVETETLYRKNLTPVSYVLSELSGEEEAPVYGILNLGDKIKYETQTAEVPWNTEKPIIKWDGEWFITYEVFRDLGAAFAVVMVLIYILVLGWFKSYTIPLIIMAPIPISLIGIVPGHMLFGAYFTATSMIGFIAGAGIIVRNSIILVDFIEHQMTEGYNLKDAVVSAGVLRFRPMLMTAAAVVVGSSVMLLDPIFQGLAISLMFGEIAATILSRFAVPVLYYWFVGKSRLKELQPNLLQSTPDHEENLIIPTVNSEVQSVHDLEI